MTQLEAQNYLLTIQAEVKQSVLDTFYLSDGYTRIPTNEINSSVLNTLYTKYGYNVITTTIEAIGIVNQPTTNNTIVNTQPNVVDSGKVFEKLSTDRIITNIKTTVTETNWSNGVLALTNFYTSSTQLKPEYYYDVYDKIESDNTKQIQFTVSYGAYDGNGSAKIDSASSDSSFTPSKTIYSQYKNILFSNNVEKIVINNNQIDNVFFLDIKRERVKQKLDVNNWELNLNGLQLIDNSSVASGSLTEGGMVYHIVSGSLTNGIHNADLIYGSVFPDHGLLMFNANLISSSLAVYVNKSTNSNAYNHLNFINALNSGSYFESRNEQRITSQMYFIQLNHNDFNFSNNPSFTTGVFGDLRFDEMINNPTTYISSIGLYNDNEELLAIAKLSSPVKKTFETEPLFRIKLDM